MLKAFYYLTFFFIFFVINVQDFTNYIMLYVSFILFFTKKKINLYFMKLTTYTSNVINFCLRLISMT